MLVLNHFIIELTDNGFNAVQTIKQVQYGEILFVLIKVLNSTTKLGSTALLAFLRKWLVYSIKNC